MQVNEIMSKDVLTVPVNATLVEAAELMRDYGVAFLPVTSSDELVGVVTDRDLIVRCICKGMNPRLTLVRAIMSNWPVCCYEDQSLIDASDILAGNHVHRLIVLDRNKKLCGLLSIDKVDENMNSRKLPGDLIQHLIAA